MSETSSSPAAASPLPAWRIALSVTAGLAMFVAILFVPAGRLDWPAGWLYLALLFATLFANWIYLRRVNPELIEHRLRLGEGTKGWDVLWSLTFAPLFVAVYVVAALEAGRQGGTGVSIALWMLGLALYVPGMLLFARAMGENPFFEKTVRIQTDRGHRVIDTGPYAFVRHPGYLGFFGWILSVPLLLGSWWAFLPALLSIASMVVRTALEDRTLRAELPGYEAYAQRVPYRLMPGVW